MATILLAGGASSRFGSPKLEATLGGSTLLERAKAAFPGAIVQVVEETQGGPVSAIAVALEQVVDDEVQIVAADVPFAKVVMPLLQLGEADATVPLDADGNPQWLCAKYASAALRGAVASLDTPVGASMRRLAERLHVEFVTLGASSRFLVDIDTPADLLIAQQLLDESVTGPLDHQ